MGKLKKPSVRHKPEDKKSKEAQLKTNLKIVRTKAHVGEVKKKKKSQPASFQLKGVRKIISKKEKQKMKQQKIHQQIQTTKEAFKEDKARKKRQKTAVVGDLKPLLDSLPSLEELVTLRDKSNKTGISSIDRRLPKQPRNKKERRQLQLNEKTEKMLDRFDHVQKIWRNPEYQKNPRKLIAEQIKLRRTRPANEMETLEWMKMSCANNFLVGGILFVICKTGVNKKSEMGSTHQLV